MRPVILTVLALTGLTFSASAAVAQDNGTITINPNGTVTESGANDPMARHDAARAAVIKAEKIAPPEPDTPKPVMKLEPESQPKPTPVKVKKTPVKKTVAPKAVRPKKQVKAPAQDTADAAKSPAIKWNKPPKKKLKPISIEAAPVQAHVPVEPARPISRDQALRSAIEVAPPFRSSRVVPDQLNGHKIFRVILQTEDGEQDILVDGMSGDILKE